MTPNDTKSTYDTDGFVIIRQFLPNELAELQQQLDRYISEVVPTLPDTAAFYQDRARPETLKQMQHMAVDPFFDNYRSNPRWQELATTLIGESAAANDPEWFNKPPQTEHPTPPHQDNYYFCLKPANVLTMWLALDDIDEENGCLRYVRGSHLRGIRPHNPTKVLGFSQGITDFGEEDRAQEITIQLQPGDLTIHHGETIHRADPNNSESRNRRAFAMVFKGKSCERDEAAYARYTANMNQQHSGMGLKI